MATLYVVATPIGNLSDITERAKKVLGAVDLVLCEDTRVTRKLLNAFGIHVETQSLHQHSTMARHSQYIKLLREGKNIALVSDAGTPNVSDPGGRFIADVIDELGNSVSVVPIPGPSALIAALSISGFPADTFTFLGFPPHKKGRKSFFESLEKLEHTVVFYESVHRVEKALESLVEVMPERKMVLARELTKMFESLYRGNAKEIMAQLKSDNVKGEFVFVLAPVSFRK
jgi:16S rRNA (cytidine1402-2'-O)-methyltransferase